MHIAHAGFALCKGLFLDCEYSWVSQYIQTNVYRKTGSPALCCMYLCYYKATGTLYLLKINTPFIGPSPRHCCLNVLPLKNNSPVQPKCNFLA